MNQHFVFPESTPLYANAEVMVDATTKAVTIRYPSNRATFDAPLRELAKLFPVGSPVWAFLHSHGIRRPSPSGKSIGTSGTPYSGRILAVSLTERTRKKLRELQLERPTASFTKLIEEKVCR